MLINHDEKWVFIHVPKTGGQSIKGTLTGYCTRGIIESHITLGQIQEKIDVREFKKVVFVRNPIDRFKSLYNFLLLTGRINDTPITLASKIFSEKIDSQYMHPMCSFCRINEVDEVGRFENIQTDFNRIFKTNNVLCKINATDYEVDIYQEFPQLKNMIKRLYFEDFIEFKYDLQPFIYKTLNITWDLHYKDGESGLCSIPRKGSILSENDHPIDE
jgi:hypothetical protein